MTATGDYSLTGRDGGALTYYLTVAAPTTTTKYVDIYSVKDGTYYTNQTIIVYDGGTDQSAWTEVFTGPTDSQGKITTLVTVGNYYKIDINGGEKVSIIHASNTIDAYTIVFKSALVYEKYDFSASYNPDTDQIEMDYVDNEATADVTWRIVRTDTYQEVYTNTTLGTDEVHRTWDVPDTTGITYKVEVSGIRAGSSFRNPWLINPTGSSPLKIPFWDANIQNAVFVTFLMFLAGLFYYATGARGAMIVALVAAMFRYFEWITVPWFWIIAAALFAFLANLMEGA